MAYDASIGLWLSRDPSGIAGGANPYEAFNNDPINWDDPDGLAPEPVWSLNIPNNPKDVTDLGTATQFKNEAYNRSQFYKNTLPPAPPPPLPNPLGGPPIVIPPQDYDALQQQWWDTFKDWEAREKELSDANTQLKQWLLNHTDAKYGQYHPSGTSIRDPLAPIPDVKEFPYHISRPWGVATWNVLSAGIIGKGGPGSKSLDDVDPSSGFVQPMRTRPGTSREPINPDKVKDTTIDARANAAEAGAEVTASALQEGLNGLKEVDVITWTKGTQSGFYIRGQPATIGDAIIQSWTGVQGLWQRGRR